MAGLMETHLGPQIARTDAYRLQSVPRMRLYEEQDLGVTGGRSIDHIYALASVVALVILIACVNFVNLTTARSARRAREVGLRKVAGSQRGALVGQFMVEAILVALLAGVLALAMANLALPAYNDLLSLDLTLDANMVPWGFGLVLATGVLCGTYPALFLSGFQPAVVLKGGGGPPGAERLRRGLVVLQFAASTLLLIGTFTVHRQLQHIADRDLGFDAEGIVKVGTWVPGRMSSC